MKATSPLPLLELDKSVRETFVKGTLPEVQENFQELMRYCANDTAATLELLCQVRSNEGPHDKYSSSTPIFPRSTPASWTTWDTRPR